MIINFSDKKNILFNNMIYETTHTVAPFNVQGGTTWTWNLTTGDVSSANSFPNPLSSIDVSASGEGGHLTLDTSQDSLSLSLAPYRTSTVHITGSPITINTHGLNLNDTVTFSCQTSYRRSAGHS
jgi:hypothetical protein